MAKKPRGRQKIAIERIESQDHFYASFSKRRLGIFKKAGELSTLCGMDIGLTMFSPTGNPYSFFSPTMESVIERFNNPDAPQSSHSIAIDSVARVRINELNRELNELSAELEAELEQIKTLVEQNRNRPKGWWEATLVNEMNRKQMKELKTWLENLLVRAQAREEEIRNLTGTSASGPNSGENVVQ